MSNFVISSPKKYQRYIIDTDTVFKNIANNTIDTEKVAAIKYRRYSIHDINKPAAVINILDLSELHIFNFKNWLSNIICII